MCQLCIQLKSSSNSLKQNLDIIAEAISKAKKDSDKQHLLDLSNELVDKAMPFSETNKDVEKEWHDKYYEEE